MPRTIRMKGNDLHYHIILRCNNGEYLLNENDFEHFINTLKKLKKRFHFKLYNYTLLHSHVHMIISTHKNFYIDEIMHNFCLNYARAFNKRHKRSGHLWKNRYRSKLILNDLHALACLRYQHRNPDKAGIVSGPGKWPWCGYLFYAKGVKNILIDPHPVFTRLAVKSHERQKIYQKFVENPLTAKEIELFERNTRPYSSRFQKTVQKITQEGLHKVSGSL